MAANQSHRRRGSAAAAVLVVAAALALGCTRVATPGTADPATSPPPVGGAAGVEVTDEDADFPATAQEYAERTVAAWSAPDLFRLAELATATVHAQIVELPGPPNRAWAFITCQPESASTDCTFHNLDGDTLVLTIDHALLGTPHAATDVSFDPIVYPTEARAYVAELLAAWQVGNLARMRRLASPEAVTVLQDLSVPAFDEVDYLVDQQTVVVLLAGTELVATVDPDQLGDRQAVRSVSTVPG